jgi:fumarate reductase (CoM/CoB) subunit A
VETLEFDVLIIGGGAAGCRAAYEAKREYPELNVAVAVNGSRSMGGSSNSIASEALGINAPFNFTDDGDDPEIYYRDTVQTGNGLADPVLCRILANDAAGRVGELIELGVQFEKTLGKPRQQKLSGCTKARSLTAGGNTGKQIVDVLGNAAQKAGVSFLEDTAAIGFCKNSHGEVCGVYCLALDRLLFIHTGSVVLATGGAGSAFSINVTPYTQDGTGWAMAYEAGCRLVNMEFFQIGPAVVKSGFKFIIHSHMWRFNPKLTNKKGDNFLSMYCKGVTADEALALKAMSYPFSVRTDAKYVDIAIFKEIAEGRGFLSGGIHADFTHVGKRELLEKVPITYNALLNAGIDIAGTPFDLCMAVQNFNGGIMIDENGYTGVPGLYAAGEVTGGVHGADRPGGNNLTDTQVFGYRAGRAAAEAAKENPISEKNKPDVPIQVKSGEFDRTCIKASEKLFYDNLTVIRTRENAQTALDFIHKYITRDISTKLRNRLLVGCIIANAELERNESRGTHYREDFPDTNPNMQERIIIQKGSDGGMQLKWEKIPPEV